MAWLSGNQGGSDPSGAPDGGGEAPQNALPAWATRQQRGPSGLSDEKLALFVGPKWEPTYKRKLAPFLQDPAFVPTWNWAAAIGTALWFLYRKLYLAFAVFFILPQFAFYWLTGSDVQLTPQTIQDPENRWLVQMNMAVVLSSMIAAGGTGNWFLFRRARAAIRLVELQGLPEAESNRLLQRIGGVNRGGLLFMLALAVMMTIAAMRA
jgi:hypothetical protein